jgi:hypothetical protein
MVAIIGIVNLLEPWGCVGARKLGHVNALILTVRDSRQTAFAELRNHVVNQLQLFIDPGNGVLAKIMNGQRLLGRALVEKVCVTHVQSPCVG